MGIQFYETGYGQRFFDSQLPALIKALNRIADEKQIKKDEALASCFPAADSETRKRLVDIMENAEKAEAFAETFFAEISTDDEPRERCGFHMVRAILDNNIEEFLVAVTGWTSKSLLNIAEHGKAYPEEV